MTVINQVITLLPNTNPCSAVSLSIKPPYLSVVDESSADQESCSIARLTWSKIPTKQCFFLKLYWTLLNLMWISIVSNSIIFFVHLPIHSEMGVFAEDDLSMKVTWYQLSFKKKFCYSFERPYNQNYCKIICCLSGFSKIIMHCDKQAGRQIVISWSCLFDNIFIQSDAYNYENSLLSDQWERFMEEIL